MIAESFFVSYVFISFLTYYIIPDYGDIIYEKLSIFFNAFNKVLSSNIVAFPFLIDDNENNNEVENKEVDNANDNKEEKKVDSAPVEVKFEDKYKKEFKELSDDDLPFTSEEEVSFSKKLQELVYLKQQEIQKSITLTKSRIYEIKQELDDDENTMRLSNESSNNSDSNSDSSSDNSSDSDNELELKEELEILEEQLVELLKSLDINIEEVAKLAREHILNLRKERLLHCYVFEKTPLGNVSMCYNSKKDSFEYYSDNTMPYRFLEPVGRKYVLTFKCKNIFVDMDEELKEAETRANKKAEEEKLKKEEEEKSDKKKKNVFAKLKEYNSSTSSGAKCASVGAKSNNIKMPAQIQANFKQLNAEPEKLLLKERSNHYTCQGKFANMKVLQSVNRKLVDKKYAMTFADFKKANLQKNQTVIPDVGSFWKM
jgi:hypothetical protein